MNTRRNIVLVGSALALGSGLPALMRAVVARQPGGPEASDGRPALRGRAPALFVGHGSPMNARLGLPSGLAALGFERSMFERVVVGALADHCHKTNPRIATADEYREILAASM